jgi:putative drug exporter of the RND superfamily
VIPRYQCKPADPWISLMMFTIVSGLSMDHEVFLLSRMREEWARCGDNSQAVQRARQHGTGDRRRHHGLRVRLVRDSRPGADPRRVRSRPGGGVLVDATVVRMVLVPALVQLLGPANWWLPRWIGRAVLNYAIKPNADDLAGGGLVHTRPLSAEGCRVIPGIPAAGRTRAQLSRRP